MDAIQYCFTCYIPVYAEKPCGFAYSSKSLIDIKLLIAETQLFCPKRMKYYSND